MPYIKRKDRAQYEELLESLAARVASDRMERPGHLNYIISTLLHKVYGSEMRYADHNEAIGMLSCVLQELYRRKTAPYEDKKIREEGDVGEI